MSKYIPLIYVDVITCPRINLAADLANLSE